MEKPKRICIISKDEEKLRLVAYWFEECFSAWNTQGISVHTYKAEESIARTSFSRAAKKLLTKEQQNAALKKDIKHISELQVQGGDLLYACTEEDFEFCYYNFEEYNNFACAIPAAEDDWVVECLLWAIRDHENYGKRCSELYALRHYIRRHAGLFDGEHDGSRFFKLYNKRLPLRNHVRDEWPADVVLGDLLSDALIFKLRKMCLTNEADFLIDKRQEALYYLVRKAYVKKDLTPADMTVGALVAVAKELIPQVTDKSEEELDEIISGYKRSAYIQSVFRTNDVSNMIGRRTWF